MKWLTELRQLSVGKILDIPEVRALDGSSGLVRIPPGDDVPLTKRVRAIIDAAPFRRLANISQLGLVSRVYPSANHTRFEHSLGVYRMSLLFLKQLSRLPEFVSAVTSEDAETLILTALLHDVGHWPFCHPIEDMHIAEIPLHESYAKRYIADGPISDAIRRDWNVTPGSVTDLLSGDACTSSQQVLHSIMSGPIDVDKMDYLMRDSLHAGVPYGRNFDQQRLVSSLCLNKSNCGLAITEKGRTAAEMMVFARYVMFSEVYWHHAVRASTAMVQRAFYECYRELELEQLFEQTEHEFIRILKSHCTDTVRPLLDGLFGETRSLYKRLAQFSALDDPETYDLLARRPYEWLVECGGRLADQLSRSAGIYIPAEHVLLDAPPSKLEVQFDIDVYYPKEDCYRTLGDVSPVVRTLAEIQFDRIVKRVRVYVHPSAKEQLPANLDVAAMVREVASS